MDKSEEFLKDLSALLRKYDMNIVRDSERINIEAESSDIVCRKEFCHPSMAFVEKATLYSNKIKVSIDFEIAKLDCDFSANTYPYIKDNIVYYNGDNVYRKWLAHLDKRYGKGFSENII